MGFNWRVFLIGVAWWMLETDYFGWNARPGSVAELFADGGALAFYAAAFMQRKSPKPAVAIFIDPTTPPPRTPR